MTATHTMSPDGVTTHQYSISGINPEPWAIGPVGTRNNKGKRVPFVGANEILTAYQAALRAELAPLNPVMIDTQSELEIYFWRRLDSYEFNTGTKHQRHVADTTNLLKGTEDALQGLLFPNDKLNVVVCGHIVEQSPTTDPGLIILHRAYQGDGWLPCEITSNSWAQQRATANAVPDLGNWNFNG